MRVPLNPPPSRSVARMQLPSACIHSDGVQVSLIECAQARWPMPRRRGSGSEFLRGEEGRPMHIMMVQVNGGDGGSGDEDEGDEGGGGDDGDEGGSGGLNYFAFRQRGLADGSGSGGASGAASGSGAGGTGGGGAAAPGGDRDGGDSPAKEGGASAEIMEKYWRGERTDS